MSENVFQRYSAYYDLLYRDKDYPAEAAYVVGVLRAASPVAKSVLEFGSGTGGHGQLLARHGFQVFGVERSQSMVDVALRGSKDGNDCRPGSFDCMAGDINTVRLDQTFDAVAALFHVVSYQTNNCDVLQTFGNAARHLCPNGVFVFDVWHGPAVFSDRPSVRIKRVEDDTTRLTRIAEPEMDVQAGVVIVRYTMIAESKQDGRSTTFGEEHRMRYFFPTEIDLLARQTGFTLEGSEEFLSGNKPSQGTWGVTYVLRKQA
jgi:SAM-dependent methyltransferase